MIRYLKYKIKNFLNFNKRQLGEIQIELSKKKYNQISNIREAELKIFSQFGSVMVGSLQITDGISKDLV